MSYEQELRQARAKKQNKATNEDFEKVEIATWLCNTQSIETLRCLKRIYAKNTQLF